MRERRDRTERWADDLSLTRAASAGDREAQRRLAERLAGPVRTTVGYLLGGDSDAEDVSQLAIVEILRAAGSFRQEGTLGAFAQRIATRTTMRHLRRRRRRAEVHRLAGDGGRAPVCPDESLQRTQLRARLAAALQKLSFERRLAVVLHHVQGWSIAEIAELTEAPPNTVRDRLRQGRRLLRKRVMADPALRSFAGEISS
ncbi:MAG: sigma-70 family RNA polymerase sigma factor [Polyangia bacterium]